MAAGLSRPDVWLGIALNRDPNDVNTPSVWTSLQSSDLQVQSIDGEWRGRDYELAQPIAADPVLGVRDVNEYLNPDNPLSPYAGLIEPYREVCAVCQWPVTATGGNNNLINSGTWRGSGVDAYDPSFESYTTGATAPNWLDCYRVARPTITTVNPQQGTKSATFTVDTSATGQGIGWGVPCIPGRQYTTSAYVRQGAANTTGIFLEGVAAVWDRFNRTSADSLGTPDASWTGAAYTTSGGAGTDYDVAAGSAVQTNTSANVPRFGLINTNFFDSDQTIRITAPVLAAGDSYVEGLTSRWVDASNQYRAFVRFNTDGSMGLVIERRLAATNVFIATAAISLSYTAGDRFDFNFRTQGISLIAGVWPAGGREAGIYQVSTTDTSAALQAVGKIGFMSYRFAANTNANLPATFSRYSATASVAGTSTATSGAYVRLSVTYTADGVARPAGVNANPLGKLPAGLAVSVLTVGATSAATVNVDAIQHEPGGAASAFATAGPVIYPLFRNFAERYPRTWRAKGYEGIVAIPCVDSLALLNKIFVSNPADQSILNTQPDYFWTLNGGSDSAAWPDSSGNSRAALIPFVSKFGSGVALEPGAAMSLGGDLAGVGVHMTADLTGGAGTQKGTALKYPGSLPGLTAAGWSMSFACWVQLETKASDNSQTLIAVTTPRGGGAVDIPFQLKVTPSLVELTISCGSGTAAFEDLSTSAVIGSGTAHFIVGVATQTPTTTTMRVWADGVASVGNSFATSVVGFLGADGRFASIGADMDDTYCAQAVNGLMSKVAIWNRAITDDEVQSMFSAGRFGLDGETSGARVLRHLQEGPYNGPTRIAQEHAGQPQTAMGVPSFDGSIDLLTDSLNTMQAEQGMFWVQPDGVIAFEGRQDRWLRLTSTATFGESAATGELPYQDGIVFDHDPTYVFPIVTWTRAGGATAVGGLPTDRQLAAASYFPRQFDGTNDLFDDGTAQDIADWIFYTHRAPNTRVAEIEIDPWSGQGTPYSMWAAALSLEVGQRVTAVRRVTSANAGAGLTMSVPCFIERIGAPEINFKMDEERWTIALQLSPIGSAAAGRPTVQPWILEDTTYGVLDVSTVLGF